MAIVYTTFALCLYPKIVFHHKTNLHSPSQSPQPKSTAEPPQSEQAKLTKQQPITTALLTGVGRSAIAVIGVAGQNVAETILNCFEPATKTPFVAGAIRYGTWCGRTSRTSIPDDSKKRKSPIETPSGAVIETAVVDAGESVVVVQVRDDLFEIHCHGGTAATTRVLEDLQSIGANVVAATSKQWEPAEPTLIREAKTVLSQCLTAKTAAIAMDQVRGAIHDWCLQSLSADISIKDIRQQAQKSLSFADFTARLGDRFHVVLAGHPNVGKSSLVNAMVGYDRSITMDVAGTTRDVLHADTVINGIPIRLSDTAGMRSGAGEIEQQGIDRAQQATATADLVVWVTQPQTQQQTQPTENEQAGPPEQVKPGLFVLNKADLLSQPTDVTLQTVATTGQGVDALMQAIADSLVEQFPPPGQAVPVNARQRDCLESVVNAETIADCQESLRRLLG